MIIKLFINDNDMLLDIVLREAKTACKYKKRLQARIGIAG